MWHRIYTCIMYLVQPLIWLFILLRSLKASAYRQRIGERYGLYASSQTPPKPNGVLIHAASVGEVIAATPLVKAIQRCYPDLPIILTTVTPTGSERVKAAFGDQVSHFYLPYDLPGVIKRFIRFIQPKVCIVIETEIWPNLIYQLHKQHIPFIIANARLSARSAKRYGWLESYIQAILSKISLIAPQDNISGQRYLKLGYDPEKLKLTGNIKYDLVLSESLLTEAEKLKAQWKQQRPVWVAASTHEGEESLILESHRLLLQAFPDLLLILVPRHPERFNEVAEQIEKQHFTFVRRSENRVPQADTQVVLGDTMGELMLMYALADVAFVGGSLVKRGGHNPLEPLAFQIPVVSGKYTFNFPEVYRNLMEVQGFVEVNNNAAAIARAVEILLNSSALRARTGKAGYGVLLENRGALQRLLDLLQPYLDAP
ncbi:lipid IV(A) 3-deoxy-D-manno-octulosonic acid transferase [Avibacterium paragallinarum]|uniref:lipid IV(A) 3-deoxy-D-manno-octulosonic acid transferase n=1 Tax=Avibacterium paragallinarum TaxID=728 RepID=UPI0005584507|nr:lipid IV(A) 3-deoxy-D-manno-octulosonic acid transferase [Avibacterium paragallinarum]AZI13319.1 3-deoxy-D-manno-octulosonic acid transferase [Avibacterium paragallinarum]QIR12782.1 3-deoxy-D-manno-octulosonic acid transferase [Avibacterium paragallinarum]QJE10738.1 3-deoxy-D-manno-octulosonic acid transferase [Avibacterium paragallinarum]QJE12931.1 3-deoxy-D-manno-octulosonic acid transferase [Avibacterium paragallinarum]QJE15133.1 3-deoxy-D-manno-octulosonic acid transferase [Avibacterium